MNILLTKLIATLTTLVAFLMPHHHLASGTLLSTSTPITMTCFGAFEYDIYDTPDGTLGTGFFDASINPGITEIKFFHSTTTGLTTDLLPAHIIGQEAKEQCKDINGNYYELPISPAMFNTLKLGTSLETSTTTIATSTQI